MRTDPCALYIYTKSCAPGFCRLRCLRAFSLLCALHTSTRVQSTLDAHAPRVRASPAMHMISRGNTPLTSLALALALALMP